MPRIAFVAGDPSGDVHASHLIQALKSKKALLVFSGLGGPAMQQAGMALLNDLTKAAAIGPFDAFKHAAHLKKAKQLFEEHLQQTRPDLVILTDFGDYNLPFIAPMVKRHQIPIYYYISPQIWAWGRFRLQLVQKHIDHMLVFFKFEEDFYRAAGVSATWVGHPLVEQAKPSMSLEAAAKSFGLNSWRRTVGLLPGSREQEIRRHLPVMLAAAKRIAWRMPGVQFVLPRAPGIKRELISNQILRSGIAVTLTEGSVYDALQTMEAAIVASGTATLDAALCGVPMAVIYKTTWPTYFLARSLLRIPNIALINVVAGKRIVPEYVQARANSKALSGAIIELMRSDEKRMAVQENLRRAVKTLGDPGSAERAAETILRLQKW